MHGGSAKFSDLYELQEDIGVGSYSICKRCVHRVSAVDYAVKVEKLFTRIRVCRSNASHISVEQVPTRMFLVSDLQLSPWLTSRGQRGLKFSWITLNRNDLFIWSF